MALPVTGQVGPAALADGVTTQPLRQGRGGDVIVSTLHGRFYEANYRGAIFGNGTLALTALSANTITLSATTTPILGVWNPPSSTVNVSIIKAVLASGINAAAATGPGAFVWATATGVAGLTLGTAPFNHKTLTAAGSQAKGLSFVALTGLNATNNLVVQEDAGFPSPTVITTAAVPTSVQTPSVVTVNEVEGAYLVPPGGLFVLLNTVSTTTVNVAGRLIWEEIAL